VIEEIESLHERLCDMFINSNFINPNENAEDFCKRHRNEIFKLFSAFLEDKELFKKKVEDIARRIYDNDMAAILVAGIIKEFLNSNENVFSFEVSAFIREFLYLTCFYFIDFLLKDIVGKDEEEFLMIKSHLCHSEKEHNLSEHYGNCNFLFADVEECPISKVCNTLSFRLNCFLNKKLCKKLQKDHAILHFYGKLFRILFEKGLFVSAYLVLLNIAWYFEKFMDELKELQVEREKIDIDEVVDFILSHRENFHVVVIDPSKIAVINRLFGYSVGDMVFRVIEEAAYKFLVRRSKEFAIVKCALGCVIVLTKQEIENPQELIEYVKHKLGLEFKENVPDIDVVWLSFKFPAEEKLNKDEVVSFIRFKLRQLKKNKEKFPLITVNSEAIEEAKEFEWVYEYVKELKITDITVALQAIYDLKNRYPEHYEVLVRFKKDDQILPAYKVIDLIYELNLIDKLDIFVLRTLLLKKRFLKGKKLFVNLSPRTFGNESLEIAEFLIREISKADIKLGIEITEQDAVRRDILYEIQTFTKRTGTSLVVDDFGTGYSSFSSFLDLIEVVPVSGLKIDGSYVKKVETSEKARFVIKSIAGMAKSLNFFTVAEFIENERIANIVSSLGVDYGQGYYFAKPELID